MSVLVIDDAASMRSLLAAMLKGLGVHKVYDTASGDSALKMLDKKTVDIIFCDWEMPEKTGIDVFNILKENPDLNSIPFILVTSVAELEKVKQAKNAGIEHYIVKPFKETTIMDKLNQLFPEDES